MLACCFCNGRSKDSAFINRERERESGNKHTRAHTLTRTHTDTHTKLERESERDREREIYIYIFIWCSAARPHIYIYIYRERERERQRERERDIYLFIWCSAARPHIYIYIYREREREGPSGPSESRDGSVRLSGVGTLWGLMSWWASESFWRLCLLGASGLTLLCQSRATGQRAEANQSLQKVPGVTVQYGGDSIIRGGFWGYYGVYIYICTQYLE